MQTVVIEVCWQVKCNLQYSLLRAVFFFLNIGCLLPSICYNDDFGRSTV